MFGWTADLPLQAALLRLPSSTKQSRRFRNYHFCQRASIKFGIPLEISSFFNARVTSLTRVVSILDRSRRVAFWGERPLAKPIKHLNCVGKRDFILVLGPGCADTYSLDSDEPLLRCGSHANGALFDSAEISLAVRFPPSGPRQVLSLTRNLRSISFAMRFSPAYRDDLAAQMRADDLHLRSSACQPFPSADPWWDWPR